MTEEHVAARKALGERWYREGWHGTETLPQVFEDGAARWGEREFIFHSDLRPARATLRELLEAARPVAGAMHRLGLRHGDVIAVQMPNWIEGTLAYLAANLLGLVVVPIVHIYGSAEVGFILRQSGARALVVPDVWRNVDYAQRVADLREVESLDHVVVVGDDVPDGAHAWTELVGVAAGDFPTSPAHADDACMLIYTSGTTSDPKGVVHSHNTLLGELRTYRAAQAGSDGDVFLQTFPAGHIGGVLALLMAYFLDQTTVLMDRFDGDDAAALIEEHGVTASGGPPFFLAGILEAVDRSGYDVSSLERFGTGGAGVAPSLIERAESLGIHPSRSYGSTEHPVVSGAEPSEPFERRMFTDGRIHPGNEVRVVDDDGREVPPGQPGELLLRGPEQFVGYRDQTLDAEAFTSDGWFRTGDVGTLDAEGWLTITDRKKDIIIRGGENISSKEVEEILVGLPEVQDAAVVGAPDERYGERVCAFVVAAEGRSIDLPAVQRHFAERAVAKQKTPERIEVVTVLPRSNSGKVKKHELRARLR